jgi:hypothetical protein
VIERIYPFRKKMPQYTKIYWRGSSAVTSFHKKLISILLLDTLAFM